MSSGRMKAFLSWLCFLFIAYNQPLWVPDTKRASYAGSVHLDANSTYWQKVTADAACYLLQALLSQDAHSIYNFQKAMLCRGQQGCVFRQPHCKQYLLTN